MQGVPSSLIARNESWVRQQAAALARRLPSNVEKADLIQSGLIAVAQAALGFKWEGDPDSDDARQAFVRYARLRVKGAMIDELRQMDHLGRAQRRKVKVIEIARERWRGSHAANPSLADLSRMTGIEIDEISRLEQAALVAQTQSLDEDPDAPGHTPSQHPATPQDEVEARVDTAIVMRRLEKFFATLPPRDRQVIDAYLGVGMSPIELAASLQISRSRVSQLFNAVRMRLARHFGHNDHRALDRLGAEQAAHFDEMVVRREAELAHSPEAGPWGELVEHALTAANDQFGGDDNGDEPLKIGPRTRWG